MRSIVRDYPRAIPDEDVLSIARAEQRVVITNDRDFGDLIVRRQLQHAGLIYLRLRDLRLQALIRRLDDVLANHADDLTHVVVVTERRIRVRHS